MSATKSQVPFSHTASRIPSQMARTWPSISRTCRGVNPAETSRRRRTCSGASNSIIIGSGGNFGRIPLALEKVAVSVETALMSA